MFELSATWRQSTVRTWLTRVCVSFGFPHIINCFSFFYRVQDICSSYLQFLHQINITPFIVLMAFCYWERKMDMRIEQGTNYYITMYWLSCFEFRLQAENKNKAKYCTEVGWWQREINFWLQHWESNTTWSLVLLKRVNLWWFCLICFLELTKTKANVIWFRFLDLPPKR